jgi:hypothetical protein
MSGYVLVLRLMNWPLSTIFLLVVGNVSTVWYFLFLILLEKFQELKEDIKKG